MVSGNGSNGIRMKVLRNKNPFGANGPEDVEEEAQHLIVPAKKPFESAWGKSLRILFILLLSISICTVMLLVVKEWYLLAHQAHVDLFPNPAMISKDVCAIGPNFRFDCFPAEYATETECRRRGCCWNTNVDAPGQPWCYFSAGFSYYDWTPPKETVFGLESVAVLKSNGTPYPRDVKNLLVKVYYEGENTVRIKISDNSSSRFEVPLNYNTTTTKAKNQNYNVKFFQNGFQVFRNGLNFPLFDSTVAPLIYSDQFLQISSTLPSEYIYGIGEVEDSLKRNISWTRSVLWTHDTVPQKNTNLYGSHPFYFVMENSGSAHGVFLANSNAMEVILQPAPAVTFRTIGGILDLRVYVGPTPADVMRQYTETIRRPFLPPYWSLGFHLCRYNYGTLKNTREILEKNLAVGIPVDVQWNDLDYMQNQNDFTYDKTKFAELPEFVRSLHSRGMHYIPLVDPGISAGEPGGTYPPYDLGVTANVFIRDGLTGKPFAGKVWNPVSTVWPDFTHPNVTHYWMTVFDTFHQQVGIDGAWIDMNEPSNFWDGTKDSSCDKNSTLDYPPYVPHVDGGKLFFKTICPSALHHDGISHYNLHSLYGTLETKITSMVLGDIRSERQFIISRSTFPGQGHYGGHWTGDVVSNWDHLRKSIPQIINFGLFGIPMVGADICGFNGNTTVELCKRWHQLGAFYPFARNHNTDDGNPQDPASLGEEVVAAARETLRLRYSLLPYIYSLFFHAHLFGEPVARALFYEFPHDPNTYFLERTFMLGSGVLVVPIVDEGHSEPTIETYLPKGWWYQHYNSNIIESLGEVRKVPIPVESHSIPLLYRDGSVIIRQQPAANTVQSRKNPFSLHAYLTAQGKAAGEFYWDDGITPIPDVLGGYNHYELSVDNRLLRVEAVKKSYNEANLTLSHIEVRGILSSVSSVLINNINWETFSFNVQTRTLLVNTSTQALSFTDGLYLNWNL